MERNPILTLETSAINQLADDSEATTIIAALRSSFHVRLPFTCASEVIATTKTDRREVLVDVCRKLLGAGDCIDPPGEILRKLIAHFESNGPFDWRRVNLRFRDAETEIARQPNFDDDLAAQEREHARHNNEIFDSAFADSKREFDELAAKGEVMPRSVPEFVARLQNSEPFWRLARNIYDRAARRPADDATIRKFYAECEPFRALMAGLCAPLYDRCVRPQNPSHPGPSLRTGRNDTFMAIYLSYCDEFVTDDSGQFECFKEVVSATGLAVNIRAWREFRDGLFLNVVGGIDPRVHY